MKKEIQGTNPKNIWQLIIGILLIAGGIFVLFNPITALIASALTLGFFFVFMGIGYLMIFRKNRSYTLMTIGILDILIGLIFIGNLGITALSMPIIFALWCLFIGVVQVVSSIELKDMQMDAWKWLFSSGLLGILFAILIFFYPAIGTLTITFLMGAYLVIYGSFELNRYIKGY